MIKTKIFKVILYSVFCIIPNFIVNAQVVINAGVGGNATTNILKRLEKDVLNEKPDLVILMVGTNDMLNSKKMISYKTYRKNMKVLVDKIKKSGSDVLLMSSPPADSVYLFERHNKEIFKESPNEKLNKIRGIVSKIALDKQVYFLDVYQAFVNLNVPKHNKDLFFRNAMNSGARDGVHPTVLGYHFIAELVFQYLKKNSLLEAYNKIICLGDSITNGSGVKDKVQAYPGVLQSLIDANIRK
ncbi:MULTISPECIES: GDSL-type esterase/lipase family protein [unclassified Algibacter]|uniref:SGNH/GDSL hydrolase family protein n=1 Tax=unclassified Algibacter TaxID=2615009 RepID=UPI00131E1C35|nr:MULTISPECIES: GDSL-type esterase/lipase family protein [unclassified Algibacter]MCL5128532.1 GDSL-type esterase/lipase family protein [Algibacter sp. L4_22]